MAESQTHHGYLVNADISGYTFFLANTELEHANIALSILLETIVEKMGAVLTISRLQGDAVCAYLDDAGLLDRAALPGLIDGTYRAFRNRAQELSRLATCPCRACKEIPSLDLKFIVHRGDFIIQKVAGIQDLLGSDVNLVHRLMKNHVTEATGWNGYALYTLPALEGIQAGPQDFLTQSETYEHLGQVQTYVLDLHQRYAAMKSPGPLQAKE